VRAFGLQDRFRWLDNVDDGGLPPLYRQATAMVAPSLYEGFGMILLEARAAGAPVAAASNGAYEEVGGDDAIYFEPESIDAIAETLVRLSQDSALRERLRVQGLAHVRRCTWARMARETLAVYRRVLRM